MYLENDEHEIKKWWCKKNTQKLKRLPISNVFDCYGVFFKHREVKAFNKFQIVFVVKINPDSLVPQNEPPMLNIVGRLQNLRKNSINFNRTLVFKRCNLGLNPLL